ncbi:ATP-binding protein [Candidatus Micrarchaeota archaeon]|nr:ATP-binding protein [Candidatus Micrarchaeota archaeon]MBU2477290.1 ATP-binding protein [Candidatus Micrarchaeota archaeon]
MVGKEKWIELIKDFHEKPVPVLIERELSIPLEVPLKRAISIIGPRRAGKTYTMYQLISLLLKNKIPFERVLYANFERTDLNGCNAADLDYMLESFYEIYPENKKNKVWLFLDEIQNVEKWEKFVRTVIDYENVQVFISGSSSKLLSREIATSLRGRTITYSVFPFSFVDYLAAEKIKVKKYFSSSEKSVVINKLMDYLQDGGYPEVILYKKEKDKLLQDIIETTVYRDVIERYKIRNIKLLKLLMKSLVSSSQKEFSVNKFYNFVKSTGVKASKNALYNYVNALNDVFFIFSLRKFSYSYKEAEQSLPKIYLIDNGLLTLNGINGQGRLMENLVFIELMRRNKDVHYFRSVDNKETDFVVLEKNKAKQLIQVSFSLDDFNTKEREIKGLLKAGKELNCSNLLVITWGKEGEEKIKGKKIKYVVLWKWLLENHSKNSEIA